MAGAEDATGWERVQKVYHEQSMHFKKSPPGKSERRARRFIMSRACTLKSAGERAAVKVAAAGDGTSEVDVVGNAVTLRPAAVVGQEVAAAGACHGAGVRRG